MICMNNCYNCKNPICKCDNEVFSVKKKEKMVKVRERLINMNARESIKKNLCGLLILSASLMIVFMVRNILLIIQFVTLSLIVEIRFKNRICGVGGMEINSSRIIPIEKQDDTKRKS